MSLLTICTNAANNIGIAAPSSIIGNTDPAAIRLLQMARREGQVLSTRTNWVALVVEHVFVADGTSDYQLPADFRSIINDTMWDRSRFWKMRGPMTPQQWQLYKSGIIGRATIERRWRVRIPSGDPAGATVNFELDPSITETTSIFVYEYVSKNWARSATAQSAVAAAIYGDGTNYTIGDVITLAGGTFTEATQLVVTDVSTEVVYLTDGDGNILTDADGNYLTMPPNPIISVEIVPSGGRYTVVPSNPVSQASTTGSGVGATFNITWAGATQSDWQADSDTSLLDEDLLELGVIWRTMRRLGLAYDEELNEYNNQVSQAVARDGGTGTLSLVPINRLSLISPWQVQEGTFPGT
jgi:hypothetical protein